MFGMPRPGAMPAASDVELDLGSPNRVSKISLRFACLPIGGGKAQLEREDGEGKLTVEIDERGRFKIQVPPKQHTGCYSGEIQDRCGGPCGWMKVSIGG